MIRIASLLLLLSVSVTTSSLSATPSGDSWKGWKPLAQKLIESGIPESLVSALYRSPDFPEFHEVSFRLAPKESSAMYGGFTAQTRIQRGRVFVARYRDTLESIERVYEVPPEVVSAIVFVETDLGNNLGQELVINRLSRIANIGEKQNVLWNYQRLQRKDSSVTEEAVQARADYLVRVFYPEVEALFLSHQEGELDVFSLRGSIAGAFGIPQFLPTNFRKYRIDGNHNGKESLFETEDALWSVGNFLHDKGWHRGITYPEKRHVIWQYNKSDAYIDTILKVATLLKTTESRVVKHQ